MKGRCKPHSLSFPIVLRNLFPSVNIARWCGIILRANLIALTKRTFENSLSIMFLPFLSCRVPDL